MPGTPENVLVDGSSMCKMGVSRLLSERERGNVLTGK